MKEALGGSGLFNIVIVIVSALVLLLVGFLAFSKAFKVKNHIINFINEDKGFVDKVKIESDLMSVGYSSNKTVECADSDVYKELETKALNNNQDLQGCTDESVGPNMCNRVDVVIPTASEPTSYDYCVFKYTMSDGSYYYTVLTYAHMNIPIIDDFVHIPITGETKTFERKFDD